MKNVMCIDLTQLFGSRIADYLYNLESNQEGAGVALFRQLFYKDYYDYNVGGTWVSVASVNGDDYPVFAQISLGQEVYGAEVDVVNGVATVTHKLVDMTTISWSYISSYAHSLFSGLISDSALGVANETNILCSIYKPISARPPKDMGDISNPLCICQRITNAGLLVQDDNYTSKADFEASLSNAYVVYPLAEPFDIQLTPQQIETLIGNNTIFADTGDVDLTYNDLDIAKRGSFREVFKLP
jgi:hypothetical protein